MTFLFVLALIVGLLAPFLRRYDKPAVVSLAGAAAALALLALAGILFPDQRQGLAAIEANRRQYLFVLACEIPVLALALALISAQRLKKLFWLAWGIHAAFTACVLTVVIWLQFFWHW
jgi:hypothetical protein